MVLTKRSSLLLVLALLVALMAYVLPLLPDPQVMSAHVVEKRGLSNMERTNQCNASPDAKLFFNPLTGRYGKVCYLDDTWFVVIVDGVDRVITGFPKEKMSSFKQVMQYMKNSGYELIH